MSWAPSRWFNECLCAQSYNTSLSAFLLENYSYSLRSVELLNFQAVICSWTAADVTALGRSSRWRYRCGGGWVQQEVFGVLMRLNWSNSRQAPATSCLACDGAGSGWRPDNIRRGGCSAGALKRLVCFHLAVVDEETTSKGGGIKGAARTDRASKAARLRSRKVTSSSGMELTDFGLVEVVST